MILMNAGALVDELDPASEQASINDQWANEEKED